jgi:hypothetical protein
MRYMKLSRKGKHLSAVAWDTGWLYDANLEQVER